MALSCHVTNQYKELNPSPNRQYNSLTLVVGLSSLIDFGGDHAKIFIVSLTFTMKLVENSFDELDTPLKACRGDIFKWEAELLNM